MVRKEIVIFKKIFFHIYFGIAYFRPTYQSFDLRIRFTVIFSSQKELHFATNMKFLCYIVIHFAPVCPVIMDRITKSTPIILIENWHQIICLDSSILVLYDIACLVWMTFEKFLFELEFFSHSFEINSFLVRQLNSLQIMRVSSAKFTI